MQKFGLLFFTFVFGILMLASGLVSEAGAGGWLAMTVVGGHLANGSSALVLKVKKKKQDHSCPEGYVRLDKPNKYGALCEPKEGLPATEPEKCKFGMIGTPPNDCHCPAGTEFAGYKGCLKPKTCKIFADDDYKNILAFQNNCLANRGTPDGCVLYTSRRATCCCTPEKN